MFVCGLFLLLLSLLSFIPFLIYFSLPSRQRFVSKTRLCDGPSFLLQRVGVVDPLLTVISAIRRTIAKEFLTTAVVMAIAHLIRLFFVNLPTLLPIFGLTRITSRRELTAFDKPELLPDPLSALGEVPTKIETNTLSEKDTSIFGPDRVKQAELLAREIVAAVTRDQCAERAACLLGSHCSQYSFTPSVMR